MDTENRVWAPHRFTPWRGKDYDCCNTCGESVEEHEQRYEPQQTCGTLIAGVSDTVCDRPVGHGDFDEYDSSEQICSGIRGNAR